MKIIPKKYINLAFPFLVALLMSIIMSGYITFVNLGFGETYLADWFRAWYNAFLLALPVSYLVVPLVRKLLVKVSY